MESDEAKEVVRKLRLKYIQDQLQAIWDNIEKQEREGDPANKKEMIRVLWARFVHLEEREREILLGNPNRK